MKENMDTRKYLNIAAAVSLLCMAAACAQEVAPDEIDSSTRIGLFPAPVVFNADGTTSSGEESYVAAVTIVQGDRTNAIGWTAEAAGRPSWVNVSETVVASEFDGTYEGDSREISQKGIEVSVSPNTEYRRSFVVEIAAEDGTVKDFEFTQFGEKADASVSTDVKDIEFTAAGGDYEVAFYTNMGDVCSFSAEYDELGSGWLTWESSGAGMVTLTASPWTDVVNVRTAEFIITVGSESTSLASVRIPVSQLAADLYYYLYGESAGGLAIGDAIQLEKVETGVYRTRAYFMKSADGKNPVILNENSRVLGYPCYCLAQGGVVEKIMEGESLPEGPEIDVDGLRTLTVDFNAMTWSWERISTANCMPDEEVANYKTKSYIARDGTMKTWMVEHIRWDGGGITPKLGAKMVSSAASATGGYASDAVLPQSYDDKNLLNPQWEESEIGGSLQGDDSHGRIYTFSEMVTGVPRWGLDNRINQTFPAGFQAGDVVTDAVGNEITLEYLVHPACFTGDNDADEEAHPSLTMQIQGICPYGWHIANAADYLDIAYAAAKASAGHTYPVQEDQCTYRQFTTSSGTATVNNPVSPRGIGNFAAWLRYPGDWTGAINNHISDGAEEFGFNYYPLGFRYMKQGYQMAGLRCQLWVPLLYSDTRAYRLNVVIKNHNSTYNEMCYVDNGNAILPFRCVKNYKK